MFAFYKNHVNLVSFSIRSIPIRHKFGTIEATLTLHDAWSSLTGQFQVISNMPDEEQGVTLVIESKIVSTVECEQLKQSSNM